MKTFEIDDVVTLHYSSYPSYSESPIGVVTAIWGHLDEPPWQGTRIKWWAQPAGMWPDSVSSSNLVLHLPKNTL